jgi:hypothetical protein
MQELHGETVNYLVHPTLQKPRPHVYVAYCLTTKLLIERFNRQHNESVDICAFWRKPSVLRN